MAVKLFGLTRAECESAGIVQRFNTKDINGFVPQDKWGQFAGLAFDQAGEIEARGRTIAELEKGAEEFAGQLAKQKEADATVLREATEKFAEESAELEARLLQLTTNQELTREVLTTPADELEVRMAAWAETLRLEEAKDEAEQTPGVIAEMTLRTQVGGVILPLVQGKAGAEEELRRAKAGVEQEKAEAVRVVQEELVALRETHEKTVQEAAARELDLNHQLEELRQQGDEATRAHEAALRLKDEQHAAELREAQLREEELQRRFDEQAERIRHLETEVPVGIMKAVSRSAFGVEDGDVRGLPDAIDLLKRENAQLKGRLNQLYGLANLPVNAFDRLVALIQSVGRILTVFGYDNTQPFDGQVGALEGNAAEIARKSDGYDAVLGARNRYRGERDAVRNERSVLRGQVNQLRAEQRSWTSYLVNGVKLGFSTPGRVTGFFLDVIKG